LFSIVHISARIAFDVKEFKEKNLYPKKEVQVSFCNVIISIWLICFVAISMIFTTGLLIFHIKIMKVDKTTREELKKIYENPFLNPFQRSVKENIKNILLPNISKKSIIDELKENRNDYNQYINDKKSLSGEEEEEKEKDEEEDNEISNANEITNINNCNNVEEKDIDIIINNDADIKQKKRKKEKITEKEEKKTNEINNEKENEKNNNKNTKNKKLEKKIMDNVMINEDKSSSNDIMTNHTIISNDKTEKNSETTPIKNRNFNMKNVNVMESQGYLPPPTTNNVDKNELNGFKEINNKQKKRVVIKRNKK
jgi:hypothetical protein